MKKILVGVDGSPRQKAVLAAATELARRTRAKLVLFRAVSLPTELPPEAYLMHPDEVTKILEKRAQVAVEEAARDASVTWLRPVLMTTLVAMFGLLPAAVSTGIGSETQKPLATVVIGGALALAILARVVQTPLLVLVHGTLERRRQRRLESALAGA